MLDGNAFSAEFATRPLRFWLLTFSLTSFPKLRLHHISRPRWTPPPPSLDRRPLVHRRSKSRPRERGSASVRAQRAAGNVNGARFAAPLQRPPTCAVQDASAAGQHVSARSSRMNLLLFIPPIETDLRLMETDSAAWKPRSSCWSGAPAPMATTAVAQMVPLASLFGTRLSRPTLCPKRVPHLQGAPRGSRRPCPPEKWQ